MGGRSNALGIFTAFVGDEEVRLYGVEAGGSSSGHAATLSEGSPGVLHGSLSYLLQDDDGQVLGAHSIAPGLDYPGVGPEHAWLRDSGRVEYVSVTDSEAMDAFQLCAQIEGIIPALEPAHALAHVGKIAGRLGKETVLVMNMCGRGDKDVFTAAEYLGIEL